MLEIQNMHASYDDLKVLWEINLHIGEQEIVAIVGSNGAGKSTLLKSISRLIVSTATALHFHEVDLLRLPSHEVVALGIVQVPEGRHIFPEMTVMENLRVGSYVACARKDRRQNLERVFSLFPRLSERKNQPGGTLSGGEQQMLAIGRGLMANPRLLLLDEPTLGLSPLLARQMMRTIAEIHRQGTSVLLVEQNVVQSLSIAHRGYVLERGHVALSGTGAELLDDPHVKAAYLGISEDVRAPTASPLHSYVAPTGAHVEAQSG
jgi:branched-chain amino acid transport system ATP-binding protein